MQTEQEIIQDVLTWFDSTFPNVHPMQQVEKLVEEWGEYQNATTPEEKEEEAADVAIVVITLLRGPVHLGKKLTFSCSPFLQHIINDLDRNGHNLLKSIPKKLAINKQRTVDGRWDK